MLFEAFKREASPTLRQRGVSGRSKKYEELEKAKVRVLTDEDLRELLQFSRGTGKPLNLPRLQSGGVDLRGAKLSRPACPAPICPGAVLSGPCSMSRPARAWLADADLSGAQLDGAKLTEAGPAPRQLARCLAARRRSWRTPICRGCRERRTPTSTTLIVGRHRHGPARDPVPPPHRRCASAIGPARLGIVHAWRSCLSPPCCCTRRFAGCAEIAAGCSRSCARCGARN